MKQAEFFQHWNQQYTSRPNLECFVSHIQAQKLTLVAATN